MVHRMHINHGALDAYHPFLDDKMHSHLRLGMTPNGNLKKDWITNERFPLFRILKKINCINKFPPFPMPLMQPFYREYNK